MRERDPRGRPLNARPRDGLGRPMPRGTDGGVPRIADDVLLPPFPALAEAQRLLDAQMPFHAHEILEGTWKIAVEEERDLWQGLAQLAVGLTHLLRGNTKGARTLLTRGSSRIAAYRESPPYRIDIDGLLAWAGDLIAQLDGPVPEPTVPRLQSFTQ